ncbi:ribonucleotide-diphosphate reductase subunit beta [Halalkalicoccus jeotgali]|uniref:Ribonucleotide reductase beta subunit-like protein n=1 Tax=Halalkalicoccus jeotgali (strain DSM 18796 / CECT 7217 / JCM 14584 / KCTC 4019 / B3) TaxID=795797 RepID=D8J2F3_HALJB|nr:ribonucleotide-diphosphate reductase subunit beta [Halalkalicoccus jeotgali]ADJ14910.1 Ribonucleotide reductase beta subunit-like protein [Halalkalicoccus jeotgali B3]ELY39492.1 Ribonucleotide reductase subunit beta-like protein [Halalkalicoccus jeotgali B3]
MNRTAGGDTALNRGRRTYRYYRNAVERHWDPAEIDLSVDRERLSQLDGATFTDLRRTLALFGAGEAAVTEDLAPLAVVLEGIEDQMFVTTQLYEEAKHADFFDRYWRAVIHPAEEDRGLERTSPLDDRWFFEAYHDLFERNERAMDRVLKEDTPENRARALCHYHLTIEGVIAQTGYYAVQTSYSGEIPELPLLPGLVDGFTEIRGDEGRHVGFGMAKLKELVERQGVSIDVIHGTVNGLLPLTQEVAATAAASENGAGLGEEELTAYAAEKHLQRMEQLSTTSAEIPDVEDLVSIE